MGLFSKKQKEDPAYKASQKTANQVMEMMANQTLPPLPVVPQAAQPAVTVPHSLPSYLGGGTAMKFGRSALPNQLPMIAAQLTAGGYGAPNDSIYRDRVVAPYVPPPPQPVTPPPAAVATPVAASAAAPAAAPAAARPLGFTGARQTGYPEHENPGSFQTLGQFINFLNANRKR